MIPSQPNTALPYLMIVNGFILDKRKKLKGIARDVLKRGHMPFI